MQIPQRTVVGAMFEFRSAWQAAAAAMQSEPHHRPPQHPVLYIKPANTWARDGDPIVLPPGVDEVEVGATLGVGFARTASGVTPEEALSFVSGYAVVNDVTVPHSSLLRPPMKQKCRDGFCPIGPLIPSAAVANPDVLVLRAYVNGELMLEAGTSGLRRSLAHLISAVSEFMSLSPGDLLLIGVPHGVPRARAGDTVVVEIEGLGRLENVLQREEATA